MKKTMIRKTVFALAVNFSLLSCSGKDPVEYNNKMMTIINSSDADMSSMNTAMTSGDFAKAEEVRKTWASKIDKQIKEVRDLGDFKGDATFKDAVLKAIGIYKTAVTKDYPTLIEIRKSVDKSKAAEEN